MLVNASTHPFFLTEQLRVIEEEEGEGRRERVLRSEHRVPSLHPGEASWTRKRKPLTPQQLEERRSKVSGRWVWSQ